MQACPLLQVPFAKRAKQVDVLELKQGVWRELSLAHQHQKSRTSAAGNAEVRFENVMSGLTSDDGGRLEELSVHLVFVCLLHLANEKNLVVNSTPALDTLLIQQE